MDNYLKCKGDIPIDLANGTLLSLEREKAIKLYSIGFQPAKCIPEIPRWFLQKYAKNGEEYKILEPFAGSGTTIIEAIENNNTVYWMDNNPLSQLICKCKSSMVDIEEVNKYRNEIINTAKNIEQITVKMKFRNIDLWFQKSVQESLEILRQEIIKIEDEQVRNVLYVTFSMTVRKMSEMEDSMILASRRSNNREMKIYTRNDVYDNFCSNADRVIKAFIEWNEIVASGGASYQMQSQDAREIEKEDFFDAIVTSPPYINAMDYIWACKFELHWLNLVENDKKRLEVSSDEIGTERITASTYRQLALTDNEKFNEILSDIYYGKKYKASKGQNELRSRVAYQYFEEMKKHFAQAYKSLKKGGKYCFIIGDKSSICGVEIPVAELLVECAQAVGFTKIFDFNLLLKNRKLNIPRASFAGTIKHDSVIILEK